MPNVLITGASRGIGRACALRFAREGWNVAINYHRSGDAAASLIGECTELGVRAIDARADVSSSGQVSAMTGVIRKEFGSLDSLILNAGIYIRAPFEDHSVKDWHRTMKVNLDGAYLCVREALPLLREGSDPTVVFVSSQLALRGTPHGAPYASSKAAMLGLMKSLALDLAPEVRVNALAPGMIDTDLLGGDTPEKRAEREAAVPLGRVGTAAEMAEAVWFLASPASSYTTGATLHCNGGVIMP